MEAVAKHGGWKARIADEIRAKILAEDPAIPHQTLAHKYGCSGVTVGAIRKAAGVVRMKAVRQALPQASELASAPASPAAKTWSAKTAMERAPKPQPIAGAVEETVSIHLEYSASQLDMIWATLSMQSKAIGITAAMQAGVAG